MSLDLYCVERPGTGADIKCQTNPIALLVVLTVDIKCLFILGIY